MRYYIGLDIGKQGGLAAIDQEGTPIAATRMPLVKAQRGHDEISAAKLVEWLVEIIDLGPTTACLEYCHTFGYERRSSIFDFGRSDGKVRASLEVLRVVFFDVDPQVWGRELLLTTPKNAAKTNKVPKNAAQKKQEKNAKKQRTIDHVLREWPNVLSICNLDSMTDGVADAFCLAEYARRLVHQKTETPQ